jgi:uncharacterized protein HemX
MFTSVGLAILGLFGKGWTDKAAKIAGIGAAVVLLVLVLGIGKCSYDRSVIERHEGKVHEQAREADHAADLAHEKRRAEFDAQQDQIAAAAAEAAQRDPEGAAKPVGPVSRSYYDNLPEN